MSCDEIRQWLTFLLPTWGRKLAGVVQCPWVRAKADGRSWIYPTQQVRFSHVLRRIISGELILRDGKPVLADHPQPLVRAPKISFSMKTGRVTIAPEPEPAPTLPSFKALLDKPPRWGVLDRERDS